MEIRAGFEIAMDCPQPTPMILLLSLHPSRLPDLLGEQRLQSDPPIPFREFRDAFGNVAHRLVAPAGRIILRSEVHVWDSGAPDPVWPDAEQHRVEDLPDDTLPFLHGSRYCDTDRLSDLAWSLFGGTPPGWGRVQAICDHVHQRIAFNYNQADPTRSAGEAQDLGCGVCRDYAHLAIALCRCMNIPARYCTGYLGDIGVPPAPYPMDFSAWFEAYLGGAWYSFDARHNHPRIGRILMARGRDAADTAMVTSFGIHTLLRFHVETEEVR
ncbi:transglutaminase-like domain-containing protein [Sabulicella rubraurantiaca]|uniref:transglutaminase-like domain-containing protein n=1 Tax=Sabulicella rubraurantiaca TaxID=2811429 RepID=UPI001A964501|nr:transglutaminase family protein [Sabulicella rubraurantiaca]